MTATCPRDPRHRHFVTVAHVSQDWLADQHGEFIEELETCDVVAKPNADNQWTCFECKDFAVVTSP